MPLPFSTALRFPPLGASSSDASAEDPSSSDPSSDSSAPESSELSSPELYCAQGDRQHLAQEERKEGTRLLPIHLVRLLQVIDITLLQIAHKLSLATLHLVLAVVRLVVALHAERLELSLRLDLLLPIQYRAPDVLVDVERLVSVRARFESDDELALERLLEPSGGESFRFAGVLAALELLFDRDELGTGEIESGGEEGGRGRDARFLHLELLHLDEVLRDLGDPLLALVHQELGPVDQVRIDLPFASAPSSHSLPRELTCSNALV